MKYRWNSEKKELYTVTEEISAVNALLTITDAILGPDYKFNWSYSSTDERTYATIVKAVLSEIDRLKGKEK